MRFDERTRELIAVGASVTANCLPCLQHHIEKASAAGAEDQELDEAIEIAKMVRKGAASKMDSFASTIGRAEAAQGGPAEDCGCKS
jgi:AhpD family alkylhydroperoxidase